MHPDPIIPDDWSPEQAHAVYEFLIAVRTHIWDRYQEHIIEHCRILVEEAEKEDAQLELFAFNDEIPF